MCLLLLNIRGSTRAFNIAQHSLHPVQDLQDLRGGWVVWYLALAVKQRS